MFPTSIARIRRNAKGVRQGNSPTAKNSSSRRTVALIGLSLSARVKLLYLSISQNVNFVLHPRAPPSLHVHSYTYRHDGSLGMENARKVRIDIIGIAFVLGGGLDPLLVSPNITKKITS